MSFPRLGALAKPAKTANPAETLEVEQAANLARTANPQPRLATLADLATPADPEKQASIHVRLLLPDHADDLLRFWRDDIHDLLQLPDEAIVALAQDYLKARDCYDATVEDDIDLEPAAVVRACRCIDCLWFERVAFHKRLGHCLAGEPEPPAGLWDTDKRGCTRFARSC